MTKIWKRKWDSDRLTKNGKRMGRRAERTYFNTEYMPHIYEDAVSSDDPLEAERKARYKQMDFVLHDDRSRFYKLCRKHGYDCTIIKNEARRKHPDF